MSPRRVTRLSAPSARLAGLIEGDLSDYRRETGDGGRVRFVPPGTGPVLDVASRIEKKFLGRTEIAVFAADLGVSFPDEAIIAVRHTGGLKRTGVTAVLVEGGEAEQQLARALASDHGLTEAVMPLDFTRFEIIGGPEGTRVEMELVGASHVAIALPPIRSYVHLYPDQRVAMEGGIEAARRVIHEAR